MLYNFRHSAFIGWTSRISTTETGWGGCWYAKVRNSSNEEIGFRCRNKYINTRIRCALAITKSSSARPVLLKSTIRSQFGYTSTDLKSFVSLRSTLTFKCECEISRQSPFRPDMSWMRAMQFRGPSPYQTVMTSYPIQRRLEAVSFESRWVELG